MNMKLLKFIRSEIVLFISAVLAVVSVFIIPPDREYAGYINYKTICILFALMAVMEGFKKTGVFSTVSGILLERAKGIRTVVLILVYLCFFLSMFITNDVSLITFVPLSIAVLSMAGESVKKRLLVPVIVIQTVAANLGSMLFPMGNPQNLYLYGISGMKLWKFILLLLPYTGIAFAVITLWSVFICKNVSSEIKIPQTERNLSLRQINIYSGLFVICVLSVAGIVHYIVAMVFVVAVILICDRKIFRTIDYSLLLTFIFLFVFIGNMGRVDAVDNFLKGITNGNEFIVSVLASQIISNVPCAILLSGFTDNYQALIAGTNIGGLGTLIASMASLISFKNAAKECPEMKGRYFVYFTVSNILLLLLFVLIYFIIG
ncbi:MAG: SLC13 family permease [Oscillospiraceae bacterium]